jgi:putative transposase
MIAFIDDHRDMYGVEPIGRVIPIAPSNCDEANAREGDAARCPVRVQHDAVLREAIRRVWQTNRRVYGMRRVWRQLRSEGIVASRCTVERLMQADGLRGVMRRRLVRTTIPRPRGPAPRDLVERGVPVRASESAVGDRLHVCATWRPRSKCPRSASSPGERVRRCGRLSRSMR